MNAREKAIETIAGPLGDLTGTGFDADRTSLELVEELEAAGLSVVDRDEHEAAADVRRELDTLHEVAAQDGTRVFRLPDGGGIALVESDSEVDLDEFLPAGAVELVAGPERGPRDVEEQRADAVREWLTTDDPWNTVEELLVRLDTLRPAEEVDEQGRTPSYRRGFADGRNAQRAGAGDPEALAARFHAAYEELAPSFGYATREASAKPWAEVPEPNRSLMVAVAARILRGAGDGVDLAAAGEQAGRPFEVDPVGPVACQDDPGTTP